jgi:hypothetical protein
VYLKRIAVFKAYSGFTDELQLAIGKTGTVIGIIHCMDFAIKEVILSKGSALLRFLAYSRKHSSC